MPEITSHRTGAPCWTELFTPDPAAAERFYTALLSWDYVHVGTAFNAYTYATSRRHMVAGLSATDGERASWIVVFATKNADRSAERVIEAGGEVRDGPRDFGVQGRALFAVDNSGAHVGFWQPRAHIGTGLLGERSALCWAELTVHDAAAADHFYGSVLDFHATAHAAADSPHYAAYRLAEGTGGTGAAGAAGAAEDTEPVAGRSVLGPDQADTEPFWMPYFGVADAAGAARTATREGGSVLYSGSDATGRGVAVLADPWGATFAVLELPAGE